MDKLLPYTAVHVSDMANYVTVPDNVDETHRYTGDTPEELEKQVEDQKVTYNYVEATYASINMLLVPPLYPINLYSPVLVIHYQNNLHVDAGLFTLDTTVSSPGQNT